MQVLKQEKQVEEQATKDFVLEIQAEPVIQHEHRWVVSSHQWRCDTCGRTYG